MHGEGVAFCREFMWESYLLTGSLPSPLLNSRNIMHSVGVPCCRYNCEAKWPSEGRIFPKGSQLLRISHRERTRVLRPSVSPIRGTKLHLRVLGYRVLCTYYVVSGVWV
jgi:hypothetical protein